MTVFLKKSGIQIIWKIKKNLENDIYFLKGYLPTPKEYLKNILEDDF